MSNREAIQESMIRDMLLELNSPEKVEDYLGGFFSREDYTAMDVIDAFNKLCEKVDVPDVQDHLNTVIKRGCFSVKTA
jgi:hypothetical protein